MTLRFPRWAKVLGVVALGVVVGFATPGIRQPVLRAIGGALVIDEPVRPADIIVISPDSGGAGVLEAADLVQSGIASRVAVLADPPSFEDHEFIRRGLPYEDGAARMIRQLASLGVTAVERIPRTDIGTEGEGEVIPEWTDRKQFGSIVVVASTDHSRRLYRVLERSMQGRPARFMVKASRYSAFDPDHWWETRTGIRTAIIELQKLALDYVSHPLQR